MANTSTDWRALCAELVAGIDNYDFDLSSTQQDYSVLELARLALSILERARLALSVLERARAALAQPEPEGPTDEELLAILSQAVASFPPIHPEAEALSAVEYDWELEIRKARAVIAAVLARWGRPTTTTETP